MKMPKLKDMVAGVMTSEETAPDIREQITKDAELKRKICEAMNQFDEPIAFTVYQRTGNWNMRNVAFWKKLNEKDSDYIDYITEVLSEKV